MTSTVGAVDQGTTSTKGAVLDNDGTFRVCAQHTHQQLYPSEGWVEHDPQELLANVRRCLEAVAHEGVDTVGLANQGETVIAWDAATGRPIAPAIVWQDNRTRTVVERLKSGGAEEVTVQRAGLPLDPYFSAAKLAWLLEHGENVDALAREGRLRLGTSDAYFLDQLCGCFATDVTTASRTSLMNIRTGTWDPVLCDLFGVPGDLLPEIRPTDSSFGEVGVGGRSIAITASVVDQQAALYGHGCRAPGDAKVTFGTGAFALAVAGDEYPQDLPLGLLPTLAWQRAGGEAVYAVDGGVYDAGAAWDWVRGLGLEAGGSQTGGPAVDRGVVFVPALSGLACPYWDRSAAGVWVGMTRATTGADLARAVLEGVALLTAEVLDVIARQVTLTDPVSIDGGLANHDEFCRFLATVTRRTVRVPSVVELTLLGAAELAADGAGFERSLGDGRTYEPGAGDARGWRTRFSDALHRSRAWR